MEQRSWPMLSKCWHRPCSLVTLSSWTICQLTNPLRSEKPLKNAGATLCFLPPYSPDFNPIEMAFSKLKAILKKGSLPKD
jgi:hypothetical protein